VLGTPKNGEWEDTFFDIFEYGERGWAYAVRLNDGIFGWLPYKFTARLADDEDPALECEDAEAKARQLFEKVNLAVYKEEALSDEEPWEVPSSDPPKLDQSEEAAELAAAWLARFSPNPDAAETAERPENPRGPARARCLSPDDAAVYLGISEEELDIFHDESKYPRKKK
jgi:hypothetical protein